MKFLKLFTIAAAMFVICSTGFSQSKDGVKKSPEERATHRAAKMDEIANLSDEQQRQIYSLFLDHFTQIQQFRNSNSTDKEAMKNFRKQQHDKLRNELSAILTDEQEAALKQHRKNNKGKHKDKKNRKQR